MTQSVHKTISVVLIAKHKDELTSVLNDLQRQSCDKFEVVTVFGSMTVSQAWNKGITKATGDIILFTESDCSLPYDWVETLSNLVELKGFAMGSEIITTSREWSMSNVGIKADIARKEHMDERFTIGEDTEWFERIAKRGFSLQRLPRPIVYHHRNKLGMHRFKQAFLSGKNRILIMLKHVNPQMNLRRIVLSRVYHISYETTILIGAIWGIIRYSYLIPIKLLKQVDQWRKNSIRRRTSLSRININSEY